MRKVLHLRLQPGRLVCLIGVPGILRPDRSQLAFIASTRPPYLRRWRLYRGGRASAHRRLSRTI